MKTPLPGQGDHEAENRIGGAAPPRRRVLPWLVIGEAEQPRRERPPLNWSDLGIALLMSFLVMAESSGGPRGIVNPALLLMTMPLVWRRQYPGRCSG